MGIKNWEYSPVKKLIWKRRKTVRWAKKKFIGFAENCLLPTSIHDVLEPNHIPCKKLQRNSHHNYCLECHTVHECSGEYRSTRKKARQKDSLWLKGMKKIFHLYNPSCIETDLNHSVKKTIFSDVIIATRIRIALCIEMIKTPPISRV